MIQSLCMPQHRHEPSIVTKDGLSQKRANIVTLSSMDANITTSEVNESFSEIAESKEETASQFLRRQFIGLTVS